MTSYQTKADGLGHYAVVTPTNSPGGLVVSVHGPWGMGLTSTHVRPSEVDAFLDAARAASGREPERRLGDLPEVETEKWDPETPSRLVYSVQGTPKAYVEHDEPGVADVVADLRRDALGKLAVADRIEADAAKRRGRLARRLERRRGEISKAAEELAAEIDWQRGRRAAKAAKLAEADEHVARLLFNSATPRVVTWDDGDERPADAPAYLRMARALRESGTVKVLIDSTPTPTKKEA